MNKQAKIYIAGHRGLVGSALVRHLKENRFDNLITRTHEELDLTNQKAVYEFMQSEKPDYVFLAAAKVGGILANSSYPAQFIFDNLAIQTNVIHESWKAGVKRLLFLGSSCIYPRECTQPIKEEYLMTGALEFTNRPYAIAKIAGIEMCWSYNRQYGTKYLAVMPTNLYGPGDNFDLQTSHVIPALIRKIHDAKLNNESSVEVWGSGKPYREFLYSDEMAEACVYLMSISDEADILSIDSKVPPLVNIGAGSDISIRDLAGKICEVVGVDCHLRFDTSKPDGTPKKLLDSSLLDSLGWRSKISLEDGLKKTYSWFIDNQNTSRGVAT